MAQLGNGRSCATNAHSAAAPNGRRNNEPTILSSAAAEAVQHSCAVARVGTQRELCFLGADSHEFNPRTP